MTAAREAVGTEPQLRSLQDSVPQDWPRLAAHLARHGLALSLDLPPRQFAGGLANLNYLIVVDGREAVLRRPPLGKLPPGAYDMGREFGILKLLSKGLDLAPAALHLGDDPAVLGAPFQIIEFRRGFAVRGTLPAPLAAIPDIGRHLVPDGPAALLHNDMKLDNILLDGRSLAPVAVLDWDQCTRGDALFDLATTLSYWTESTDPDAMQTLQQMPTAHPGFQTRSQAAQAYAKAAGRDLSDFKFYRVLAMFKLAVIFHQLHARYRQGATQDARYAGFGTLADGILEFTHIVARGDVF